MSSYPLVKFVESPAVGATVRLDLNDAAATAPRRVEADFDLGAPTLEGDPDAIGQTFGLRSPRFTVQVKGTKANALAFVSALSKEMLRQTNWLMFQLNATTSPVWFKTYRVGYEPLSLEQVYGNTSTGGAAPAGYPDVWRVEVPLVADAFAYGARETLSTFQVIQAPADLAGPTRTAMRVPLPALKGDAPTALRVQITPAASPNNNFGGATDATPGWLIGCVAGSASMSDPIVDSSGFINNSGMGANVVDATYFGGGYNTVTIGAATPNLLTRFNFLLPNTIPQGQYKVLLRCRFTAGAATSLLFRLQQWPNGIAGLASNGKTVTVDTAATDTGRNFWVDFGEIAAPFGINPPSDGGGTMLQTNLAVQIGTASGAASSVNVDSIKLIPVDGVSVTQTNLLKAFAPITVAGTSDGNAVPSRITIGTFDGDVEGWWGRSVATGRYVESSPVMGGYFPIADPAAAQNVLLVMALDSGKGSVSGTSYITTLNAQAAVDVSYYPRYLHVGDGT